MMVRSFKDQFCSSKRITSFKKSCCIKWKSVSQIINLYDSSLEESGNWKEDGSFSNLAKLLLSGSYGVVVLTLVNKAQGKADKKLIIHINRIIFFAFPIVERESGDKGRQIAKYLK